MHYKSLRNTSLVIGVLISIAVPLYLYSHYATMARLSSPEGFTGIADADNIIRFADSIYVVEIINITYKSNYANDISPTISNKRKLTGYEKHVIVNALQRKESFGSQIGVIFHAYGGLSITSKYGTLVIITDRNMDALMLYIDGKCLNNKFTPIGVYDPLASDLRKALLKSIESVVSD